MHVQSCCFANQTYCFFCRSRCRQCRRCLSSLLPFLIQQINCTYGSKSKTFLNNKDSSQLSYNKVLITLNDNPKRKHTVTITNFLSRRILFTAYHLAMKKIYCVFNNFHTPFWHVMTDRFNFKRVLVYTCSLFFYVLRFSWSSGLMSYTRLRSLSITLSLFWFTLSLTCWSRTVVCSSILAWKSSLEPMCYGQTKSYYHECQLHVHIAITIKLTKLGTPEKFQELPLLFAV